MSVTMRNSRTFRYCIRVWYGCDDCGMHGSATVGDDWERDAYIRWLSSSHRCSAVDGAA